MKLRAAVAGVLLASAAAPASAALPSVLNLGRVAPTPSGIVNTKYRDGDDGTGAIPLLWGGCPTITLTNGEACTTNLRTACNLVEAGSPAATLSLFSGTLPTGCSISGDGITGTVGAVASGQIVVRATRNTDTADTAAFTVQSLASGTDLAAPTIPLALAAVDNTDGTATLSWEASGDPNVSGVTTGVASYQVKLAGVGIATVTAPAANIQPALAATLIGSTDGESSSQAGADWTLTYAGTGLLAAADGIFGRMAQVSGDYIATMKLTSYTPQGGTVCGAGVACTQGSIGIAARASSSVEGAIAVYSRWRDTDDKCNQRYRTTTGGSAANGTVSTSTYTAGSAWIKQTRVGDTFTTYCSGDSGQTWTATSSQTVSPGVTVYLGPFITSGSAGDTATAVVDDFAITTSGASYLYTGAGGTFAVNAYDGTNRSADSATVAVTPTGGAGAGGPTIPATTYTVCNTGCSFTPVQLETIVSSAANASANSIAAGTVIELRADAVGAETEWATRLVCSGVNGNSTDQIWMVVRDGDRIRFDKATTADGGLINMTSCDYWNFVGSRYENLGESNALEIGDDTHWTDTNFFGYPNERGVMLTESDNVAFYGVTVHGGKDAGVACNSADKDSSFTLWKQSHGSYCGTNSRQPELSKDSGDLIAFVGDHALIEDSTVQYGGHTNYILQGSFTILRGGWANGDWLGVNGQAQWTGNHAFTIDGDCVRSHCEAQPIGPFLVDGIAMGGTGYEPEHNNWNNTVDASGHHVIFRNTVMAQRTAMIAHSPCGAGQIDNAHAERDRYRVFYNNTLYGGTAVETLGRFANETPTDANLCGEERWKNNIFAGLEPNVTNNGTALFVHYYPSPITGYANTFKGAEVFGNIFSLHPTNPSTVNTAFIARVSYNGTAYVVTDQATVALTNGTGFDDAAADYVCEGGDFPDNWCGNRLLTGGSLLKFTGNTTAPFDNSTVPDLTTLRTVLALGTNTYGTGDAWPLTTVDVVTDTTHVSLADARYFKDAWGFTYTWGGLHTEYGDCIAMGATAATAVTATITAINYTTGDITYTPARTITNGWNVWKATDAGGGACGAVWDNRGAVQ